MATVLTIALHPSASEAQQVRYYHLDAIGSVRAISNSGGTVTERHDYLPYGEECTTGTCNLNPGVGAGGPLKFTGKERDVETGLDYFGARYQSARLARFTSIDPVTTWKDNLVDPLRWNRYAYSRNNPLRYVDPDGRKIVVVGTPEFQMKVTTARQFAEFSATRVFSKLEDLRDARGNEIIVTIRESDGFGKHDIEYRPGSQEISWNPWAGVQTDEGPGLSPATALAHEADHALQHLNPETRDQFIKDSNTPMGEWTSAEEKRNITQGGEAAVARVKGETARTSHNGKLVRVGSETETPGPKQ